MRHKHHIVPRHIGGHDGPIAILTSAEHAEAHWILWYTHGRYEDYIAALGLDGYLGKEELIALQSKLAGKRGGSIAVKTGQINQIGFGKSVNPSLAGKKGSATNLKSGHVAKIGFGKNVNPSLAGLISSRNRPYYRCMITGRVAQLPIHARYNKENYPHNLKEI